MGTDLAACGACLREPPPFARTCCAVDYAFPWVQVLQAFKFQGQDDLAQPLAQLLADAITRNPAHQGALPRLLLPVPLSPQRLRERGYNQAWELARHLGRALELPARADLLQRSHQGPTQARLSRAQRQGHLRGVFGLQPANGTALQGLHVALVDDVMTTGATVREATGLLLHAGAARVDVWVLARTPAPVA